MGQRQLCDSMASRRRCEETTAGGNNNNNTMMMITTMMMTTATTATQTLNHDSSTERTHMYAWHPGLSQ
jgi:hypothetical protein